MLTRLIILGVAIGLASPAVGQTSETPSSPRGPQGEFLAQMPAGATRLSKMIGVGVIGPDITRIGEVEDVIINQDGALQAVIVSVGGFLGIGEKKVAVPFATLLWNYDISPSDTQRSSTVGTPAGGQAGGTSPGVPPAETTGTVGDPNRPGEGLQVGKVATPVTGDGSPQQAVLRMTREELRVAPEFQDRP